VRIIKERSRIEPVHTGTHRIRQLLALMDVFLASGVYLKERHGD
jgi:hypothetical protein